MMIWANGIKGLVEAFRTVHIYSPTFIPPRIPMTRKHSTRILGCLLISYVVFVQLGTFPAAAFTSMSDDFSGDSGNWHYAGDAKRTNGHVEIAPASNGAVGLVGLKQDVRYPFVVEFRAQTSTSGEGMAFLFHHDKSYTLGAGGRLGAFPPSGSVEGWGVELDVRNSGGSDNSAPHMALVQDPLGTHYKTDSTVKFNDNKWHSFKIEIQWSTIILSFDGNEVWHFSDYSYKGQSGSGMGFSAASSGGAFRVDDFKLMSPGEAETMYWITFGVIVGTIFFGTLGGIVLWGSVKWRRAFKQYAQPGVDYRAFKIDNNMQRQILSAAAQSPDPDMRKLRSGLRMTRVGMGVAGFLMMAVIIGTLFMPPMILLTVGVVLYLIFIPLFGVAGYLAARRAKPFIVMMGQRMGWIPPGPYGAPAPCPVQPGAQPAYMAPPLTQWPAPPPVPQQSPWQAQAPSPQQSPWQAPPPAPQPAPPPVPPASAQVDWGAPDARPGQQQPPAFRPPPAPAGYQPPPWPGVGDQPYRPVQPPPGQYPPGK